MNLTAVGEGKVVLIAGGGRVYTDLAARFVGSEKTLEELISSEYDAKIVQNILERGHLAATEFDYFLFGVEGYSRVAEVQLVRKRHASYMIKTGRKNKGGKRSFDMVIPRTVWDHGANWGGDYYTVPDILSILQAWYNQGVEIGLPEEDLRYLKPQATEFKALIGMNAHALLDWFKIRCCLNAQDEIRDMATKMWTEVYEKCPDLFAKSGASCKVLGYCPENSGQNPKCRGLVPTHEEILALWHARHGEGQESR